MEEWNWDRYLEDDLFISPTKGHHTLDKDVKEEQKKKNEKGKEQTGKKE
jgi:hypothetical protein